MRGHEAPAYMKRTKESPLEPERLELERQLEALRRDIWHLKLEHDILKKANELIKKRPGHRPTAPDQPGEDAAGDALRHAYTLPELLEELGLERSSYFYHRTRHQVADKYVEVRRTIAATSSSGITAVMATAG